MGGSALGGVGRLTAALRAGAGRGMRVLLGGAIVAVLLEFVFRHLLPAYSNPPSLQDPDDLILRFDTIGPTRGVRSEGPLARNPVRWRVNNEGWNCPHDYVARTSSRPRIALLGDSYIEALYVDIGEHLESRLEEVFRGEVDVYAFGRSNWYLEQYVALARYVDERFAPDVYVIFLTDDDVVWSLREKGLKSPYLFQIGTSDAGFVELPPTGLLTRRWVQLLLRRSALACYVSNNLGVRPFLRRRGGPRFATMMGDIDGEGEKVQPLRAEDARLLQDASAFMLDTLVRDHPGRSFVFVDPSDSSAVYEGMISPRRDPEREAIRAACEDRDECHYFDLWPMFVEDFARNGLRFESSYWHWNGHAHDVIADALAALLTAQGLVEPPPGRARSSAM